MSNWYVKFHFRHSLFKHEIEIVRTYQKPLSFLFKTPKPPNHVFMG